MASLRKTISGAFIICFRYEGQQFQRSLRTNDQKAAEALQGKIKHTLFQIANGNLLIPEAVDPGDFLVNGLTAPRPQKPLAPSPTFASLMELYLRDKRGQKADSSIRTERTHLKNRRVALGGRVETVINRITKNDLETALRQRYEKVTATTVMKERQTLKLFFDWVVGKGEYQLQISPAEALCTFQENREKKRFRTLEEIEQIIDRGGLTDEEIETIWGCLYLDQAQNGEVLGLFCERARHDFIHPMLALATYTGMRRGEILRVLWSDINFESGLVTARSRKQSRQTQETSRDIPMHSSLREILTEYHQHRPQGQFVLCKSNSVNPLTKDMAHDHFQRTLSGTRWERLMPSGKKHVVIGFHTFRHSFASNLAAAGVDQRIIDSMMGHQTEEMRKRYQHLFPQPRRAAIDCLCY